MDILKKAKHHVEALRDLVRDAGYHTTARRGFVSIPNESETFSLVNDPPKDSYENFSCYDARCPSVVDVETDISLNDSHARRKTQASRYDDLMQNDLTRGDATTSRRLPRLPQLPSFAYHHVAVVASILSMGVENLSASLSRQMHTHHITHVNNHDDQCCKCRLPFGCCRRRFFCPVCDQAFCSSCYGRGVISKCLFDSGCRECASIVQHHARFHKILLPLLELGISCILHKGLVSTLDTDRHLNKHLANMTDNTHAIGVWLCYDVDRSAVMWRTLQLRNNCPVDTGCLPVGRILRIEWNEDSSEGGSDVCIGRYLSLIGRVADESLVIEFNTTEECAKWAEAIRMAWVLFAPQQQRTMIASDDMTSDMERRKNDRDARKQIYLSNTKGLRFTADAIMKSTNS